MGQKGPQAGVRREPDTNTGVCPWRREKRLLPWGVVRQGFPLEKTRELAFKRGRRKGPSSNRGAHPGVPALSSYNSLGPCRVPATQPSFL